MTAEELAKSIGINEVGTNVDGAYVIPLKDSNAFSRVYTLLDKAEGIDLDSDESTLSESATVLVYLSDDFDIELRADLDNNSYTVSFKSALEGDKNVTKDSRND